MTFRLRIKNSLSNRRTSSPDERASVVIAVVRHGEVSVLGGDASRRRRRSRHNLLALLMRHPLLTHYVSAGIHEPAMQLWRRKLTYIPRRGLGA